MYTVAHISHLQDSAYEGLLRDGHKVAQVLSTAGPYLSPCKGSISCGSTRTIDRSSSKRSCKHEDSHASSLRESIWLMMLLVAGGALVVIVGS